MKQEELLIESPEKIQFHFSIAQTGHRIGAFFVDLLIQGGVILLLILLFFALVGIELDVTSDLQDNSVFWIYFGLAHLIIFFLQWIYFILFETLSDGQSPGKKAFKLQVIKENGDNLDFPTIVLRNLIRAVDSFPAFGFLGGLVSMIDKKSRRLGDMFCQTVVIHISKEIPPIPNFNLVLAEGAIHDKIIKNYLSEKELFIVRKFLSEQSDLRYNKRVELANKLAAKVKERTQDNIPNNDSLRYLEQIYRAHANANKK